jgi:glycosyltransferase involved in cell wall biosynthesis
MRTIKELQHRLNNNHSFEHRYRIEADDKIHLLYVSPKLNSSGYYRMIAPALEINKTTTHKAIVTSIEINDFKDSFAEIVNQLDERLVTWADYILLPPLFSDLQYLVQAIKIINTTVQLVMDVDKNYFHFPDTLSRKLTKEHQKHFEKNLGMMDIVTTANKAFQHYLQKLLEDRLPNSNTFLQYLPSLISRLGYEEVPPIQTSSETILRIGLIKSLEEDLIGFKDALFAIRKAFEGKIEFVYLGTPQSSEEIAKLLADLECEIHKTVSFEKHFEKLSSLQLDIALLPAADTTYNRHNNHHRFFELAVFGIPVIASTYHSDKSIIQDGDNGFIAGELPEWIEILKALIENETDLKRISRNVLKDAWKHHSYNARSLQQLAEIFI